MCIPLFMLLIPLLDAIPGMDEVGMKCGAMAIEGVMEEDVPAATVASPGPRVRRPPGRLALAAGTPTEAKPSSSPASNDVRCTGPRPPSPRMLTVTVWSLGTRGPPGRDPDQSGSVWQGCKPVWSLRELKTGLAWLHQTGLGQSDKAHRRPSAR